MLAKMQFNIADIVASCSNPQLWRIEPAPLTQEPPMSSAISTGIHHITAIAGDPKRNVAFYTRVLGLRMVKKTVNFDDPGTYHLYYGDNAGSPGTILTFFPWANVAKGQRGGGEASETAFAVPPASITFWRERLDALGIPASIEHTPFGEEVIAFEDPDGMAHHIVGTETAAAIDGWSNRDVPAEHAIRGFFGITLWSLRPDSTAAVLSVMGYEQELSVDGASRWRAPTGGLAARIDVRNGSQLGRGRSGAGTVHHVAFRASDDADQADMVAALRGRGLQVTEQLDRNYFRSVYFREPGGTLFEIATDAPGFSIDEPAATMGQELKLPAWLEPNRAQVEAALPALV
jgi:glyoxalase family protein